MEMIVVSSIEQKKEYVFLYEYFLSGGSSYRGSRSGPYRGASRGNGGSSNYAPY
jgi:hypothetical protein